MSAAPLPSPLLRPPRQHRQRARVVRLRRLRLPRSGDRGAREGVRAHEKVFIFLSRASHHRRV